MSLPFGPEHPKLLNASDAAMLRGFDLLVGEYAEVRLRQETVARQLAEAEGEVVIDILRQRLADTSHEMFLLTQHVVATAMIMAGNGIFVGCADVIQPLPVEAG